jgi:hypothetical protein
MRWRKLVVPSVGGTIVPFVAANGVITGRSELRRLWRVVASVRGPDARPDAVMDTLRVVVLEIERDACTGHAGEAFVAE